MNAIICKLQKSKAYSNTLFRKNKINYMHCCIESNLEKQALHKIKTTLIVIIFLYSQ